MELDHNDAANVMKQLDRPCWNCQGSGVIPKTLMNAQIHELECDICYGTGYQPTKAGIELMNFLRRHKKRIEREDV